MIVQPTVRAMRVAMPREPEDGVKRYLPLYVVRPAEGGQRLPALLLLQEAFGVNSHIQDVAHRFARLGYVVAAPDLYYRTGPWTVFDYSEFERTRPLMAGMTEERVVGDLRAGLDYLASRDDVDRERIGVVGYCMGGRLSFVTAAWLPDRVKAAAVYYGGRIVADQPAEGWSAVPVDRAANIRCPVIGFFGGRDHSIPVEHVERIDQALSGAGVEREIYFYPDAEHGFCCDERSSYHPAAAQDAWYRTVRFFEQRLG